jgi:hypothetical protein
MDRGLISFFCALIVALIILLQLQEEDGANA